MFSLVGIQRMNGTSKAGNNYDFVRLHCLCDDRYVNGQKCIVFNANTDLFQSSGISVGDTFRCSYSVTDGRYSVLEFF